MDKYYASILNLNSNLKLNAFSLFFNVFKSFEEIDKITETFCQGFFTFHMACLISSWLEKKWLSLFEQSFEPLHRQEPRYLISYWIFSASAKNDRFLWADHSLVILERRSDTSSDVLWGVRVSMGASCLHSSLNASLDFGIESSKAGLRGRTSSSPDYGDLNSLKVLRLISSYRCSSQAVQIKLLGLLWRSGFRRDI